METQPRERERRSSAPDYADLWRRVVTPTEHGGWAFLGEPLLLGLLVAFSGAGACLALAALAAFLARQPLRLALADRRKGKRYPRTTVAESALVLLAVVAAAAALAALGLARGPVHLALVPVALLAAAALGFDLQRRAREAAAELIAALALGGMASAIALAGGIEPDIAFGLWAVLAARALPSILYVRARLRLDRGVKANPARALAAHGIALTVLPVLAARHVVPWLAVAALVLLAARSIYGLSPARPRWNTAQLGVSEIVLGLITVIATVVGLRFGW